MSRRSLRSAEWLATACLGAALWTAAACGSGSERRVYLGGPILTMNATSDVAEALGIEGDRIAAVGDEAAVRAWAGESAEVIELAGRAIVPGFIDAHGHFPGNGIFAWVADLNPPPIGPIESVDDAVAALAAKAADVSPGEWVFGLGYDDTLLAEKRHLTRHDLDRASSEHPMVAMHISGHLGVVNSRALAELGIDASTRDPDGGRIVRDAAGEATGLLEENAIAAVAQRVQSPSPGDALRILREATRRNVSVGITTAQSGSTGLGMIEAIDWASRLGQVPHRLVVWPSMEALDEVLADGGTIESYDDEWVKIGAVKLIADGSIQGYTGYLSQPYHVPPNEGSHAGEADYRGYPRIAREELLERVQRYHAAGWQIAVHGNGDASIDDILDAFEAALAAKPDADARPIVIHAQMTRDDQLDRMAQLGVIPSFFSLHTYYWGDRHRDLFMGPERAARMSPAASAQARGVRFTIHCDTPIVPLEPLRLVWAAVNRRSYGGSTIGEAERITPMQALRGVTIDAAYQHFEDGLKGSLEAGKLADYVLLSRSPLDAPETIDRIDVLETFVGGEPVYRR